jgi:hypothetical protein
MHHSQRVMSWNPSEGCTPTHVSHRKAEIDCGPSTASIVAWADGWRLALLEQYLQGGNFRVSLYSHEVNKTISYVPQQFAPEGHTPSRSSPTHVLMTQTP